MNTYTNQYKLLFTLSWVSLYIIFPSWTLPFSTSTRFLAFSGLLIYFLISYYAMNLLIRDISVSSLFRSYSLDRSDKMYVLLFMLCGISAALHIYPITFPVAISYDESAHLYGGLGIFIYILNYWNKVFTFPIQYAFWILAFLSLFFIMQKHFLNRIFEFLKTAHTKYKSNIPAKIIFILVLISFSLAYFYVLRNMPFKAFLFRFPPLGKILYLGSYFSLGISEIGPRILQILFCLLGSFYLFQTISLFRNKETALLGATIYLFTPLIFFYSNRAELANGTVFFIILVSYYFLRFIKANEYRDLLLASYFIGIGFMYKRSLLVMLCVCIAFLILHRLKNKDIRLFKSLKIILLAIVPIIPWMLIGKLFSVRNYEIVWSHLISFDRLFLYLSMIPSQISSFLFLVFLFSILFAIIKMRDAATLYFGILFIAYYLFFTLDTYKFLFRFSMVLYPAVSFFLAQFISGIIQKSSWKHTFHIAFTALTIYLISICTIWQAPPLNSRYITYNNLENSNYPIDEAVTWIKHNVRDGEKILTIRIDPVPFYRVKYGISKNKIINYLSDIRDVDTPSKLRAFSSSNGVSYVMFPYGNPRPMDLDKLPAILEFLKINQNNEFTKIAEFNMSQNHIFVYRIKRPI